MDYISFQTTTDIWMGCNLLPSNNKCRNFQCTDEKCNKNWLVITPWASHVFTRFDLCVFTRFDLSTTWLWSPAVTEVGTELIIYSTWQDQWTEKLEIWVCVTWTLGLQASYFSSEHLVSDHWMHRPLLKKQQLSHPYGKNYDTRWELQQICLTIPLKRVKKIPHINTWYRQKEGRHRGSSRKTNNNYYLEEYTMNKKVKDSMGRRRDTSACITKMIK